MAVQLHFGKLKRMNYYELKETEFKLKQDLCKTKATKRKSPEVSESSKWKTKLLGYVKYLLYNAEGQKIIQANAV